MLPALIHTEHCTQKLTQIEEGIFADYRLPIIAQDLFASDEGLLARHQIHRDQYIMNWQIVIDTMRRPVFGTCVCLPFRVCIDRQLFVEQIYFPEPDEWTVQINMPQQRIDDLAAKHGPVTALLKDTVFSTLPRVRTTIHEKQAFGNLRHIIRTLFHETT